MKPFPVKLSLEQILELTKQFPKEVKIELMSMWLHEIKEDKGDSLSEHYLNHYHSKNSFFETFYKELLKKIKEVDDTSISLSIQGYNEPIDLDKSAIREDMLHPLEDLWNDEISAEELVEMLTK